MHAGGVSKVDSNLASSHRESFTFQSKNSVRRGNAYWRVSFGWVPNLQRGSPWLKRGPAQVDRLIRRAQNSSIHNTRCRGRLWLSHGTPVLGNPLSHLNLILFLFLAHQCESTAHVVRLTEINFSMETILTLRAIVAIARCAFATSIRAKALRGHADVCPATR